MPKKNKEGKSEDVFMHIYEKNYPYLEEPMFGGDLLVTIVALNNEDNLSLKNWVNTYCPEDWAGKNLASLKSQKGDAIRSYSRDMGKKMLIGYNYDGHMYFLYAFSNEKDKTPETLFAQMLNTFQTPE